MGNDFYLFAPIEKIDEEKRTVAGWATTDQIDKQNEVVDYNGSKEAFNNWQGNIREMHEAKAVGKAIEINPNDDTKKIWVKAYISKGAEDTWEKIKDGVLTGFSIGGQTVDKVQEVVKDLESGGSRNISRIIKYKLNELSLVDNPANPECSFALVKSIDGIPYQTEIVEDIKKIVITEASDPLSLEVKEHREKADSLVKKVLDTNELGQLSDDDFGVIRKSQKDSTITKQRLMPMPDKVHAVRALGIMDKYNLTNEEVNDVQNKAKEILGMAYESHAKNVNRGGNNVNIEGLEKKLEELTNVVTDLVSTVKKGFEGAYKPIEGSKSTTKGSTEDPNLGETAPKQPKAAADVDPQTQKPEGNYPVKDSEPEKASKTGDVDKASNPSESDLRTQEEIAAPVTKEGEDSRGDKYPGKHPATVDAQTQDPKGAYPAKGPVKVTKEYGTETERTTKEEHMTEEDDSKENQSSGDGFDSAGFPRQKKAVGSENDLTKLVHAVNSLRKRFDTIEDRMRQPKPRKFKVEKSNDETNTNDADQLTKDQALVKRWNVEGTKLTPDQERFKTELVDKILDSKFGKAL